MLDYNKVKQVKNCFCEPDLNCIKFLETWTHGGSIKREIWWNRLN